MIVFKEGGCKLLKGDFVTCNTVLIRCGIARVNKLVDRNERLAQGVQFGCTSVFQLRFDLDPFLHPVAEVLFLWKLLRGG